MQKFTQALAAFQVFEKGADWDTSTDKHQAAAEDIGVSVRNILASVAAVRSHALPDSLAAAV